MGKAADKRRKYQAKLLAGLAITDPDKFHLEWNKRMESWVDELWRRAGKLTDKNGRPIPPVFEIVDKVCNILSECRNREEIVKTYGSIDILKHECAKALSEHIDRRIYHLNVRLKKE
jgi:hypothetical protein